MATHKKDSKGLNGLNKACLKQEGKNSALNVIGALMVKGSQSRCCS